MAAAVVTPSAVGAVDGSEPVTTVAGGNGAGSAANQLSNPYHVSVADGDVLYVADQANDRIVRVAADGTTSVVAVATGAGSGSDPFGSVDDVVVGPDGDLYVADGVGDRVVRIDSAGNGTVVAGSGGEGTGVDQLDDPRSLAFAADGSLHVADSANDRVVQIDGSGDGTVVAGSGGEGTGVDQLNNPRDIVFEGGVLYVADTDNSRVLQIDGSGDGTAVAGTGIAGSDLDQLNNPQGIAFDGGVLYVADTFNQRVVSISAGNGTIVTGNTDGTTGSDPGELNLPTGVAFDSFGSMFVADFANHRVQKSTVPDTTDPVATIVAPTDGATIANGATASVDFNCTDEGTSGLASCTGTLDGDPITSGTAIDTATAGTSTLIVTATDGAGNTDVATVNFTVAAAPDPDPEPDPEPEPGPRELTGEWAGDSGLDGSISRLYMAVFTRQPDAGGHAYWVNRGSGELSLREIARFFVFSPEFVETYGELTDAEFVDQLYLNVMDRPGDAGGVAFWNDQLGDGMPRSEVVLLFSESPEFKDLTGTT